MNPETPTTTSEPHRIRAPRAQGRALDLLGNLELEIAPAVKTAAKWTLAGLLLPIGLGLLTTGGLVYVALHFLAKWW